MDERVLEEARSFLERMRGVYGLYLQVGEESLILGEEEYRGRMEEFAELASEVFRFVEEAYAVGEVKRRVRMVLAEGDRGDVAYRRVGDACLFVVFYHDVPMGTALYEINRFAERLEAAACGGSRK